MCIDGLCYYFGSPYLSDIYCTQITFGNLSVYPCDFIVTSTCYVQFSVSPLNGVNLYDTRDLQAKVSSILLSYYYCCCWIIVFGYLLISDGISFECIVFLRKLG